MASRVIVIVGSGPGIGVKTASLFASNGFEAVALIARTEEKLKSDAETVKKAASSNDITIKTYPTDIGDAKALQHTLDSIKKDLGDPEVVLFNAARIAPSKIGEEDAEKVLNDFKVMNIGLYQTISWAKASMQAKAKGREKAPYPSFFLSGGAIYADPEPAAFSLCMQKAAQHNLMKSFFKVVKNSGVHVALTSIAGEVKDENPVTNAKNISEQYWRLYNEEKDDWAHQVDLGS